MTLDELREVQNIVREVSGYGAHVAGGAVRDLLYDRPIKDIDVFIPRSRDEDVYTDHEQRFVAKRIASALTGVKFMPQLGAEQEAFYVTSESEYPEGEQVYATYEVDTRYGVVNLIFVEDFVAAMNEFPDELSQAYIGDDGEVVTSEAFDRIKRTIDRGLEVGVVTTLRPGSPRIARLSPKYPEVRWIVFDEPGVITLEDWA